VQAVTYVNLIIIKNRLTGLFFIIVVVNACSKIKHAFYLPHYRANALKGGSDGAQTGGLCFSTNRVLLWSQEPAIKTFKKLCRSCLFIEKLLKICTAPSEPPANLLRAP